MKKVYILMVMVLIIVLTGCSGNEEKFGSIDGDEFTSKDFMEIISENMDEEELQSLYLSEVFDKKSSEDLTEEYYEDYLDEFNVMSDEELDDDKKDELKEMAKQDSGTFNVLKESGVVSKEDIDKEYKKNNKKYTVKAIVIDMENNDTDPKTMEKKLKKEDDDIEKDINNRGEGIEYFDDVEYTNITVPEGFPNLDEMEKEDVEVDGIDNLAYIVKLEDEKDIELDEVEKDIVISLGGQNIESLASFINKLDEEDIVSMDKDLREYLQIDKERAEE